MNNFYVMKSLSGAEEYVDLIDSLGKDRIHYMKGETQYLCDNPVVFEVSDTGGIEIPDLIYHNGIWIASNKLKGVFDSVLANYITYKAAIIQSKQLGIMENCWIIIPPSLDCMDLDKSVYDAEWDFSFGLIPMLNVEKIVILAKNIGHYEIFKVFGVMDNNIYITKRIRDILINNNLDGVEIFQQ